VPGAKSLAHRALLLAAAADGESRLRGLPESDDAQAALAALSGLGVATRREGEDLVVSGQGLRFPRRSGDLVIGSSGTVGRFLPGLLAAAPEGGWRLVSTPQLAARPLRPLLDALRQWGARLEEEDPSRSFPLRIHGGGLEGGTAEVSAIASSQFASGLLLAAPLCRRPARVVIRDLDPEETYVDMTLDLMRRFGAEAETTMDRGVLAVDVAAPRRYRGTGFAIEADANTAAYFLSLAALTGGGITVANLDPASRQPGARFLEVLRRLGCLISVSPDGVLARGGGLPLRGGFSLDLRSLSEMAPTLAVLAVFADQPIRLENLAHIRRHESDRLAALAALLGQVGVAADEGPDSLTVHPLPRDRLASPVIDPFEDHRLAMSFAILGAAANGIGIANSGCVAKTCPGFFSLLAGLGVEIGGA
jgi:3-phosphoshikimate 1-carboxyvinyltransferase